MKVILKQTVPKVGKAYQVVTVKDGYARNYLFPRGLAIVAEKNQVNGLEKRNARVAAKTAGEKAAAETLKAQLDGKSIRIEGQAGKDTTKLFGAITAQDIADAIKAQVGVAVDRKGIALLEPIKRLGNYEIEIDLHFQVDAKLKLEVFDPAAIVVATPATQEEETTEEASEEAEPVA